MALVSIFYIFCYASIAFHTERLQKQSFMGRETYEQSFNRWLKIFDTFPEGMAMIKDDGSVMYANKSLTRILEIPELPAQGKEQHSQVCVSEDQGLNTRKALERTHIKKYDMRQATEMTPAPTPDAPDERQSVWQFVIRNQDGATFELEQKTNMVPVKTNNGHVTSPDRGDCSNDADNTAKPAGDQSNAHLLHVGHDCDNTVLEERPPKYLSLDQIKVTIAGRMEKILIARDESYIVTLRELEATRRQMIEFTQSMMNLVDDYANNTCQHLKDLQPSLKQADQLALLQDCQSEMRRARYSIRDFQYIHDVAEHNFEEPTYNRVQIRSSLDELITATSNDLQKSQIEIKSDVHKHVPDFIAVEENLFIQVMINLLQQAIDTIVSRGFITMFTSVKQLDQVPHLVVEFKVSACKIDKESQFMIVKLSRERDFKKVLSADVEPHFKIALILCNQVNWRIVFDSFKTMRYCLYIPLTNELSPEEDLALLDDDEESKEGEPLPVNAEI